jgi:hypothetical protein
MKKSLLFVLTTMLVSPAFAGQFRCSAYFETNYDCSSLIDDIVTDEFTTKFPVSKFKIIVISGSTRYQGGTSSGFAVVGISPASTNTMPTERWTSQFFNSENRTLAEIAENERSTVRSAVKEMMSGLGVASRIKRVPASYRKPQNTGEVIEETSAPRTRNCRTVTTMSNGSQNNGIPDTGGTMTEVCD